METENNLKVQADREARRRRILENSKNRLAKIAGKNIEEGNLTTHSVSSML